MQEQLFYLICKAAMRHLLTTERSAYGTYAHSILEILSIDPCSLMRANLPHFVSALVKPFFVFSECTDEQMLRMDDVLRKLTIKNKNIIFA